MRKRLKKLIAVLLAVAVFPVIPVVAAQGSAAANGSAASVRTVEDVFDGLFARLADAVDRLRFRFASVGLKKGSAVVQTDTLTMIVSGYETREDDAFRIGGDFTAKLYGLNRPFNRMTFYYASTQPLQLDATYRAGAGAETVSYYLETAENGCFRCLIGSYLTGKKARGLVSLRVRTCTGEPARFELREIQTERIPQLEDGTCFLENERFRVGVKLAWGGGIHYFEDKTCPVEGLTNLINAHDTGRLVQQSYYGTAGNEAYSPGTSFQTRWVYNPVQGGEQFGNASRLIDFEIGETAVYVKAQPQDWSLDNALTPSYMENTYTLHGDRLQVDNRFVDFSGWEHPARDQELPAFYTVSGLSSFSWYDGTQPWRNGALAYRDDLPFWGDHSEDCTFSYRSGNTETWCAWSAPENGFGVGLYVPNADRLKAGRYMYNGSLDAGNDATNYVAPLKSIRIVSFRPIEYSYLLTAGHVEQIREVFAANRDFTVNAGQDGNAVPSGG